MAAFDPDAMLQRFRDRAAATRDRALPPVTGEGRKAFMAQREVDFTDYALVGAAEWAIEDGFLVLRIDMRPQDQTT
jgi:hypothetical protein